MKHRTPLQEETNDKFNKKLYLNYNRLFFIYGYLFILVCTNVGFCEYEFEINVEAILKCSIILKWELSFLELDLRSGKRQRYIVNIPVP